MMWHYQARRRVNKDEVYFDVVEVYTDADGVAWTESGIAPIGESKEDLVHVLEMMLKDVKEYPEFVAP